MIGAIDDIIVDPYTNTDVSITSFTSFGAPDDGRIKPDLVANGQQVYSPVAFVPGTSTPSNIDYNDMSGTSMAAPNVTGSAALLLEHYWDLFGGADPLSATLKGVLIQTAFDAGNVGPDYSHGWGVVDAAAAASFLTETSAIAPTDLLIEATYAGTEWTMDVGSDGSGPLKATIVWTDPAPTILPDSGLDDPTPVLVNDLDLWITGPGGTFLPWTLDPANPSTPAVRTTFNHRDNVEQVLIDAPAPGTYTIHVGRTGPTFTQDFSLAVSNVDVTAPTAPSVPVLMASSDSGVSSSDNITNDATPTLTGTAEANATVELFVGAASLGTTAANGNGDWTFTSGMLGEGVHAIRARAIDVAGNTSDDSGVLNITIDTIAPQVQSVTVGGSMSTHDDFVFDNSNPDVGSGNQIKTVPVGGADTVIIGFDEDVDAIQAALSLVGNEVTLNGSSATFDDSQADAPQWTFPQSLADAAPNKSDQYEITLQDSVTDIAGNQMDGEWTNPDTLFDSVADTFPSGDNIAGGPFRFRITILPGDLNRDNVVGLGDFNTLQSFFTQSPPNATFAQGDLDGNGSIENVADYKNLFTPNFTNIRMVWRVPFQIGDLDLDLDNDFDDIPGFVEILRDGIDEYIQSHPPLNTYSEELAQA